MLTGTAATAQRPPGLAPGSQSLRATLDRTTSVGLRIQLVLHRLGQQQQIVARARDSVRNVEARASHVKGHGENLARAVQEFEQRKDPMAERELRMFKSEMLNRQLDDLERRLAEISK